jgi:3'-5' exoribonuclease
MTPISIAALKQEAGETPVVAAIHAQLQSRSTKKTKTDKPYLELVFADSTGNFTLKVWADSPVYREAEGLAEKAVFRLEGRWTQNSYGIDCREPQFHTPDGEAMDAFFAGDPELKAKQDGDFAAIVELCESLGDPRLRGLCQMFFHQMGDRFRRTAAAKRNHHARRGGLVEHVAQMARSADALCGVYPELNRDLLITGVLFHDCGKLWENTYPERGFAQTVSLHGEMLGHIPLGIELVNALWRNLMGSPEAAAWEGLNPPAEDVRLHLLHLVGSHHGEHQFGSPTLPRTPEAFALHYIDNLDAKLEMVRDAYAQSAEIAPGIHERVFPLPASLVKPLARFDG